MSRICRACNFAFMASTRFVRPSWGQQNWIADGFARSYQEISDDSVSPSFKLTFESIFSSLRPDRALSSVRVDPPRELLKNQCVSSFPGGQRVPSLFLFRPIEASVVLLPIFEFLLVNETFLKVFVAGIDSGTKHQTDHVTPLPLTIISLASYLLTHATSTSSPRSIAYANLALSILLVMAESDDVMAALCKPTSDTIRICRQVRINLKSLSPTKSRNQSFQRPPLLPVPPAPRQPICALLDCCVLWLRHNLHKRLEVQSYM